MIRKIDSASRTGISSKFPAPIELGTIEYVNLTPDGRHGDYDKAVQVARDSGKPIFANFVEWSG